MKNLTYTLDDITCCRHRQTQTQSFLTTFWPLQGWGKDLGALQKRLYMQIKKTSSVNLLFVLIPNSIHIIVLSLVFASCHTKLLLAWSKYTLLVCCCCCCWGCF